ncbi:MAG TPA: non-canonical purine NTP pyrophosphatase, RdgB/HAM1 family [Gammaproteobacteria bacterium]|nr:non-canonical purine NTP pyrophosphatase, RdgB/HAM1 family [Gammaproteobacteria bacterium]
MQRIVVATGNAGKLAEFRALFATEPVDLVSQRDVAVPDADETGASFLENALIKARHAARATGLPALADDSGLCVDALDGAPGVYSARYAGEGASDAAHRALLLAELAGVPDALRTARFVCVLVFLRHPEDPRPIVAEAEWAGSIARAERGAGGFGYDSLFEVHGTGLTAAELAPAEKQRLSHRGQALRSLLERLAAAD